MSVRLGQSDIARSLETGNAAVRAASLHESDSSQFERVALGGAQHASDLKAESPNQIVSGLQRIFFYGVGLFLLITAVAKLWMLLFDPFADIRSGIPKWLTWLSILMEFVLAWFVVKPTRVELKSLLVAVVFLAFMSFSLFRWVTGEHDCGCFGQVQSHPSLSFSISGIVLALNVALVWLGGRKLVGCLAVSLAELRRLFSGAKAILPGFLSGFAFVGLVAFLLKAYVVGGEAIVVEDIDLGRIVVDEPMEIEIHFQNRSAVVGRIIGAKSSCSCLVVLDHDVPIQAGESLVIKGIIRPRKEGKFHNRIIFFLDHPKQIATAVDVFGFFEFERKENLND